jgi:hypothetical protein
MGMSLSAPAEGPPQGTGFRSRLIETWLCVIVGIWVGWFYVWSALQPGNAWVISSKNPDGYYPLETAGFHSGHLYVAITPHPALLALPDPYDPVANARYRVHDMSLYKGHYYLYFGVTPALLLFWPVVAVTGEYLSEPFAVGLFCSAAIWVGMGLLLAIRRRYFPAAPFVALLAGWVCLAWATPLIFLVEAPQFYQVPISCAVLLQALMLAAVYRALNSPRRALVWMGAAGLLFGLCVGARPNHLADFVALLIPAVALSWRDGQDGKARRGAVKRMLLWTFLPTFLCGCGLLYYNWARFGSVSEFGVHYQLAGEKVTALKELSISYLIPHVALYLFNPGNWESYFPFFHGPSGEPYGLMRYLPWTWLVLFAFIGPLPDEPGQRSGRLIIATAVGGAFLANLALLGCYFMTTSRYPGDFSNAALILAGIGGLAVGQRAALLPRRWKVGSALAVAALASLSLSLAVYAGLFPRKEIFLRLARAANWPAYAWQRTHGIGFGGLRLELTLPEHPPGPIEPILETGRQSDQRDWLEVDYLPKNRARLSFFHAGTGSFPGEEFDVPPDRKLVVEVRCGSLLPPFGHPVFSDWSRADFDDVKRELRVTVNGADVLHASIECYDSSPANLTLGRLGWFSGGMQQFFSGSITRVDRLPLVRPAKMLPLFTKAEPVELRLFLPAANQASADPLLLTGNGNQSDLLYCIYDGANHIKFAFDHFGAGGPISESVPYDPLVSHAVTLWMGSLAGTPTATAEMNTAPDRLVVIFDGRVLFDIDEVFYPGTPESAIVGFNAYGSTGAGREFTGRIAGIRQVDGSTLPQRVRNGTYGAVEMSVDFPYSVLGTQEPLVVTGVTGAGDFVYVRYVDANHIVIGFDHWGIGGILGNPVEVDYGQTHRLSVTFQALYPPGSVLHNSDVVRVLLDGKPALEGRFACHPSTADRIKIGSNSIGGSTCGSIFSGRILSVERFPEPRQ